MPSRPRPRPVSDGTATLVGSKPWPSSSISTSRSFSSRVDLDEHVLGLRVAGDVAEGFLDGAEDGGRDVREGAASSPRTRTGRRCRPGRGGARPPANGRKEAEVVEDRRAQVEDDAVEIVEGASREARASSRRARVPASGAGERALEAESERGDGLAGLVVQLAREATALVLLRPEERTSSARLSSRSLSSA